MTEAAEAQVQPETAMPGHSPPAPASGGPRTTALGVVDPLRLPIPPGLIRWWAAMPMTGRIFVGFALLDAVGRLLGLLEPRIQLDPFSPVGLVAAFLPRTLLILLPALLLTRRADADQATPLLLRGAILIALVELISPQVNSYVVSPGGDSMIAWTVVALLTVVLRSAAWMAIAIGLARLATKLPSPFVAGMSNVVVAAIAGFAVLQLLYLLTGPGFTFGDPAWNQLMLLTSSFFVLESFAWAYLAWVVLRGAEDRGRSIVAIRLAVGAFAVAGTLAAVDLVLGTAALARSAFGLTAIPFFGPNEIAATGFGSYAVGWIAYVLPMTAFLVAFGLGLADARARPPEPSDDGGSAEEAPAAQWPDPEDSLA